MRELIAIIRGVKSDEVLGIADALINNGITKIEVPLNSPEPFKSIEQLIIHYGSQAVIGAGTVLTINQVKTLAGLGAKLAVSPNCNPKVIKAAVQSGLESIPGVATATECFNALDAGASALKLFPASLLGPEGLSAFRAVLPEQTRVYAVGGVNDTDFPNWANAGVTGFGIGSALYRPGDTARDVSLKSKIVVKAFDDYMN